MKTGRTLISERCDCEGYVNEEEKWKSLNQSANVQSAVHAVTSLKQTLKMEDQKIDNLREQLRGNRSDSLFV